MKRHGTVITCADKNIITLPSEVSDALSVSAVPAGDNELRLYVSYLKSDGSAHLLTVSVSLKTRQAKLEEVDLDAIMRGVDGVRIFSPAVFRDQNGLLKMLYITQKKLPDKEYGLTSIGVASSTDGVQWSPVPCEDARRLETLLKDIGATFPWHLSVMETGKGCSGVKSVMVGVLGASHFNQSGKNYIPRLAVADLASSSALFVPESAIKFMRPFAVQPGRDKGSAAELYYMDGVDLRKTRLAHDGGKKPSLTVMDTISIPRLATNGMAVHDRFSTILPKRLVNLPSKEIYAAGVSEPSIVTTRDGLYMVYEGLDRQGYWTTGALTSRDGVAWSDVNGGKPLVSLAPWPEKGNWAAYEAAVEYVDGEYYMAVVLGTLDPLLPALEEEICFFHSRDGVAYQPRGGCVAKPKGASRIGEPSLVYDGDAALWRLWFIVQRAGTRSIHYAQSEDLAEWNIRVEAVLTPQGGLEENHVGCPDVEKADGAFHMFYRMGLGNGLGYAVSADGVNWKRHSQNPVISNQHGRRLYAPFCWKTEHGGFGWESGFRMLCGTSSISRFRRTL